MEVFLSEHGQTIQYAVIGVIIVALISIITNTSIKKIMPHTTVKEVILTESFRKNTKRNALLL